MSVKEEYRVKDLNTDGGANRFKFKSFSDRISSMRVDVFHKINQTQLAPDAPSYFQEGIMRWKELNQTGHYNDFVREVNPYKNSLAQILFHKDKIVKMLIKHLSIEESLATAPLLDLVSALSRDLRQEFYPYFTDIFVCLQQLLSRAGIDTVLIENAFSCLSYLFKFLQKQLSGDLPKVFSLILPLLSHQRWYIRRFAAEAFSFLIRRLEPEEMAAPIETALKSIDEDAENDDLSQGLAELCFEVIRGPKPHLHSTAPSALHHLLVASSNGSTAARQNVLLQLFDKSRRFTTKETSTPLFAATCEHAHRAAPTNDQDALAFAYRLLALLVDWKQGVLVADAAALLSSLKIALPSSMHSTFPAALELFRSLLLNTKVIQTHAVVCRNLLNSALTISDTAIVLPWLLSLRPLSLFGPFCWESSLTYLSKNASTNIDEAFSFFAKLTSDASSLPRLPSILPSGRVRCPSLLSLVLKTLQASAASATSAKDTPKKNKRSKGNDEKRQSTDEKHQLPLAPPADARLWLALQCISVLESDKTSLSTLQDLVSTLAKRPHSRTNRFLLAAAIKALTAHWRDYGLVVELRDACPEISRHVLATPKEPSIVAAVAEYLSLLKEREEEEKKSGGKERANLIEEMMKTLHENLSSSVAALREATLRLLMALPHPSEAQSLFALFSAIYRVESGFDQAREMGLHLTALENGAASFPSAYLPLLLHFLLGLFWVKFAPVWAAAQAPLTAFARAHFALYWGVLFPRLCTPSLIAPPVAEIDRSESSPIAEEFYAAIEAPFTAPATSMPQVITSLWRSVGTVAELVERHSRQLVPEFFAFLSAHVRDFEEVAEEVEEPAPADDDEANDNSRKRAATNERETLGAKDATDRLLTWLSLFAAFRNPKGLYQSEKLHETFTRLLRRPNPKVQVAALKCLMTWRHEYLTMNRERLERLVGEDTFREELTALTAELSAGSVQHRDALLGVVIQLLFPKLFGRVGRSAKANVHARRTTVLSFLSGLAEAQIDLFFTLLFEPFSRHTPADGSMPLSPTHQLSFLGIMGTVFKQLGQRVLPRVPTFVDLLLRVLQPALTESNMHAVRIECLKRLAKLLSVFPDFDHAEWLKKFFSLMHEAISRLPTESHTAPSPLLLLLLELCETPKLALYFQLDKSVLPSVLALFSSPLLARPVASLLVDFVQQLLFHAETNKQVEKMITPHVAKLLKDLHAMLVQRGAKKTAAIPQSRGELSLLSRLSKYASQPETASDLIDLLLPYLPPSSRIDEESRRSIVSMIGNSLRLLKEPLKLLYPLSKLLADSREKDTRATVCEALTQLAQVSPQLPEVMSMIADTNAYLANRLDEPDHEKRLAAFARIETLAPSLDDVQLAPLLCNTFYFLPDLELATRQTASGIMRKLLSAAAAKAQSDEAKGIAKSKYADVAARIVLPRLKILITGADANSREEALLILAHMVSSFPRLCGDLSPLRHPSEPDADFFLNVTHIQRHRRTRALQRFAEFCKSDAPPTREHLTTIFVPLFTRMVIDSTEADHLIVDAAVAAVSAACALLPWREYNTLLRSALKHAAKKPEQARPLVKLVLGIISAFHFDASAEETEAMEEAKSTEKEGRKEGEEQEDGEEGEGEEENDSDNPENATSNVALSAKISREVQQRIIPQLYTLFSGEKTPVASMVNMGEGVAHLIKSLPASVRDAQVRRLTGELLVVLQKREAAARDAARRALCSAAVTLGPKVLPFMLREMKDVLKRGFQLHVLGHVTNALLASLAPTLQAGDLDAVTSMVTAIYVEELTGEVAEKKEVQKIAHSMRETKKSKANEALEVVAKFTRLEALNRLLYPLQQAVLTANSQKVLRRLEELLRHIGQGLASNSSLTPPLLLSIVHGIVGGDLDHEEQEEEEEDEANREKKKQQKEKEKKSEEEKVKETPAARAKRLADEALLVAKSPRELKKQAENAAISENLHVLTEFGLWVLSSALKRNAFDFTQPEVAAQFTPFEVILLNALDSRYAKQTQLALKCIERLSHTSVAFLPHLLPRVVKRIFKLLARSASTSQEDLNQAMRLLATLIRDQKKLRLTQDDLRWLCEYCLNNLESLERQAIAFNLLKAILMKKLVVEEIYDLMLRVSQLIVQSHNSQVRLVCSQCLITFLLNYPLAPKRMQQHLTSLLANLSYEYEDGRVAVLETIYAILEKFPKEVLHQQAEFFFVSLVPPLVNDESEKCRRMTASVIKRLLIVLDPNDLPPLLDLTLSWVTSPKASLHLAAAQVIGLFAESCSALLAKRPEALTPLTEALANAPIPEGDEEVGNDASASDQWPLLYHLLLTLEKLFSSSPSPSSSSTSSSSSIDTTDLLWQHLPRLLAHPHAWIRLLVCRLLGRCFAAEKTGVQQRLVKEGCWFELVREHSRLLEDTKNEALGEQLLKNLIFLALFGEKNPQVTIKAKAVTINEGDDDDESKEEKEDDEDNDDEEEEEAKEEGKKQGQAAPIKWLVARLSYIAKRGHVLQKRLVFTWAAALASSLPRETLLLYLFRLLVPIFRVNENTAAPEDLRNLAKEVMEVCKEKVGLNPFWDVYNRVRGAALNIRLKRKQDRKVQAAIDPERAAAKRLKKQLKKKELRKRAFANKTNRVAKRPRQRQGDADDNDSF